MNGVVIEMNFAPVAIFAYNRLNHIKKTFEALKRCKESVETELYIFLDGPKNESAIETVREVREYIHSLNATDFKSISVIESPENKGLAASIIFGVTEVIGKHGRIIVLEDDCVASPYLLGYMNKCLDCFENDQRVGSIAGFAPQILLPNDYSADIYTAYRSCSCTWGSWLNRWQDIDWNLSNMKEVYNDSELLRHLNSNGSDRFLRLYRQAKGSKDSWSIKFGYHLVRKGMLTVYPRFSYITNIGADDTGVHSAASDADILTVDLTKAIAEPKIEFIPPDERIQKAMKKFYSGGLISDVKRKIATKAIIFREKRKR